MCKKITRQYIKKKIVTQAISQTDLCQVKGEKESCTMAAKHKHKLLTARRGRAKTINLMIFLQVNFSLPSLETKPKTQHR